MRLLVLALCYVFLFPPFASSLLQRSSRWKPLQTGAEARSAAIPMPTGIYILDDPSNERPASAVYEAGMTSSPAYQNDVTGQAIFVPIAKILPSITTWGEFNWNWGYLDSLINIAMLNGKKFSIALEEGFQSGNTYLRALPEGFLTPADSSDAPLFDVWVIGGTGGRGISIYIPLPWVPKVQEFWSAAAYALAAHLQQTGAYGSLTLMHLPGLSVYDEEIRLPSGNPRPLSTDTSHCPDGRLAYTAVIADADTARWRALGYSDSAVVAGFGVITTAFAEAFPDRMLGLSLLNPGAKGVDFPNLSGDTVGHVAGEIVREVNAIAPGRVLIQADNLDANVVVPEVLNLASEYSDAVGWQSNKHGGTGAGCEGGGAGSCSPDTAGGPYYQLLQEGWFNRAAYLEVWSYDVVNYPQSFAAARDAGFFPDQPPAARVVTLNAGWNLLSLPVDPHNDTVSALFPGAAGPAFTYSSGGYSVQPTVTAGTGYWLRFLGPESLSFTGADLPVDSVPVHAGWNLIGSVSTELPVASLTSTAPGMITSKFFGYAGSYVIADTIHPGSGYWVRCNQSGTIILSAPPGVPANLQGRYPIRVNAGVEIPPPPPGQQDPAAGVPKAYALDQAYPNPFNPSTTIRYQLPADSYVRLTVYDVLGRVVAGLVDGREEAGYKQYEWHAGELASGVYIYRLEASDLRDPRMSFTQSKKVILLK